MGKIQMILRDADTSQNERRRKWVKQDKLLAI